MFLPTDYSPRGLLRWLFWTPAAVLTWGIALAVMVGKMASSPGRATNIDRYLRAGVDWFAGDPLYIFRANKGFVYGPFSAVCYALASYLPKTLAAIVWCLASAALLLAGLHTLMKWGPYGHIPERRRGLVFLLVFPLALGNLDSAQANAFLIGLIMLAVAAAAVDRWTLAAIALACAVHWKVYPIAVGMLLVLYAPWKFSWRLALALVVFGLVPFLFQSPQYVIDQYRLWVDTRTADNRLAYDFKIAPVDFWFVLVYVAHLPVTENLYRVIQLAGAAAVAGFCLWGRYKSWPAPRLLGGLFALSCVWMVLLGPASEIHTYLILAPAAALAVVESFSARSGTLNRTLAALSYAGLLVAILRVGFVPHFRTPLVLAIQPLTALVFLAYALRRYLDDREWKT